MPEQNILLPFVIVLGDRETHLGNFVERNLRAVGVVGSFPDSTDEFVSLISDDRPLRVILIDPDWEWMLTDFRSRARLLVVRWQGDDWSPPWEAPDFEVRHPYADDGLFQRHILAWLREA